MILPTTFASSKIYTVVYYNLRKYTRTCLWNPYTAGPKVLLSMKQVCTKNPDMDISSTGSMTLHNCSLEACAVQPTPP